MIGEQIIESRAVPITEVEELLKERKKDKDLTYEQENALKYVKIFSRISLEKTNELIKELLKIEGMTPELATKIADILPTEKEIINLLPSKETKVGEESLNKVLELVSKYYKKKEKEGKK